MGGRFTVFNALCNLFRRCILNSFYGSSPQTWLEHKKAGGRIPSFSAFLNCLESQFFGSYHAQNPPLDGGNVTLLGCQRRILVGAKGAILVGTLQPSRHGEGSLFVTVPAFLREPPRPEPWVDLRDD